MSISPTIADALAGARFSVPVTTAAKSVLVAGAAGRLGERVLAQVLGAQEYRRIFVLASDAMRSTESRLIALSTSAWDFPIDHVIAVVSDGVPLVSSASRKRTEIFLPLSPEQVLPLARQAKEHGASRFMLVTLTDSMAQPGALHAQLGSMLEMDLHSIGFESLLIVRPSLHEMRRHQGDFVRRLMVLMIDTARGLMAGLKHAPLTLEDTARAIVWTLRGGTQGLSIIETERLHQILKMPAETSVQV
jgi:hypothetical protein